MPEMNGRELVEQWLLSRPDTKVLFTSGYTENAIVHHGSLDPNINFIQKPYRPETLAIKVREILEDLATLRKEILLEEL